MLLAFFSENPKVVFLVEKNYKKGQVRESKSGRAAEIFGGFGTNFDRFHQVNPLFFLACGGPVLLSHTMFWFAQDMVTTHRHIYLTPGCKLSLVRSHASCAPWAASAWVLLFAHATTFRTTIIVSRIWTQSWSWSPNYKGPQQNITKC